MNEFGAIVSHPVVEFDRLLPVTVDTAWSYLTQPERLAGWLAAGRIELRLGGQVELHFDVDEAPERAKAGAVIRGIVTRCEPLRVLAYSWTDPAVDSLVAFVLKPADGQARLRLAHSGLSAEFTTKCAAGWHTHLDILLARMQSRQPEPFLALFQRVLPEYEARVGRG